MANITFGWNPFQTLIDNRIEDEVIKPSTVNGRMEFLVRRAPFFSKDFSLFRQGDPTPLILGVDYVFAHPFDKFIIDYKRNCFGSVVLLKPFANDTLIANYDTIGGPFVLDEIEYVALAANIIDKPREASWNDLADVPTEWPFDPHEHPAEQTYDYEEMMTALRSLILSINYSNEISNQLESNILAHMNAPLAEAHVADKAALGLDKTPNMRAGVSSDLNGGSGNVLVTVALLKEALRGYRDGTLSID